ncbi:hypothetical protein Ahy_A06g030033 [Arachis hypogaea]|uniref:Uncharacterized protein n=1 Tax=Arachis hypogaea TaxID=3818 RepID=A0A445CV17_ARAHY|nr:hypothetical protein Ahy_A06g030033 [Arachis hypogaea]
MAEHHGLYLFTMHTKEHGSLLIQSLERPMKWLTMVESLFFQNIFNSDIGVHGQANFSSFATHHDVHPPPLPMHLFQGVLSKGNMLTYNQVMEVSCKKFQKDPEWGRDAPGSHHGRHKAGRYGLDLSLKL